MNFMIIAQQCLDADEYSRLEDIKINNRKLGKNARKIFQVENLWEL